MPGALSRPQFDVLHALLRADSPLTQRQLQEETGLSLGSVNSAVRLCEAAGYIRERHLTSAGSQALEPYRVENAIIMAAGLSARFAPISYERPKGMLRVRGEVLIERQIEQLRAAGITNITVVVGYKKEYFFHLADQYGVKIVINDDYTVRNNNSSLWLVRENLGNTYICSSDDYFTTNPFESHVYQAYYSAQYVAGPTQEWCLSIGAKDRITAATIGGRDSWVMLGHAYFDRQFSATFKRILEKVYPLPETAPKLWEAIYLDHIKDLTMVIRRYPDGVINEFDSLDEVRRFDQLFMENIDCEIFEHISEALGCTKNEIHDLYPLRQGITNLSCHFTVRDKEYVYRHPGIGTEKIVDRHAEFAALHLAQQLGLDSTFVTGDPVVGWKISRFIPNTRNLDVANDHELKQAMSMGRKLHDSPLVLDRAFDFISEGIKFEKILEESGPIDVPGYSELRQKVIRLKEFADADGFPITPSHNDFFPLNFLIDTEGNLSLIDWEYAGMSDIASDFGTMVVCAQLTREQADRALGFYFDREPTQRERRHFWSYVVFAGWCWYVWALAKQAEGDDVGEWLLIYYRHAVDYVDELLTEYEDALAGNLAVRAPGAVGRIAS